LLNPTTHVQRDEALETHGASGRRQSVVAAPADPSPGQTADEEAHALGHGAWILGDLEETREQRRPASAPASAAVKQLGVRKREHGKKQLVPVTVLEMVDAAAGVARVRGAAEAVGSCPILGPGKAAFSEFNVISRQMVYAGGENEAGAAPPDVSAEESDRGGPRQASAIEARGVVRSGDESRADGRTKQGKGAGHWGQGRAAFGSSSRPLTHGDGRNKVEKAKEGAGLATRSFVALRLQTVDPSGMRALSVAGGGRKRAKECIAAALGLGEAEASLGVDDAAGALGTVPSAHGVMIERVASATTAAGHSGVKKLASAVDVHVKIALGPVSRGEEGAQGWWTRSDSWIERQLNRRFAASGLPHFVLKHCCRRSLVTSAPLPPPPAAIRAGMGAGAHTGGGRGDVSERGRPQEDGMAHAQETGDGRERRRGASVAHLGPESEEEGVDMWRSELAALRNQQQSLQVRMASLRS
jgi:hypothetical protein